MGRGGSHSHRRQTYNAYGTQGNGQPSVLIIDDDVESAQLIKHMFDELGFHTQLALSADEAFKMACSYSPDLVILDWILGVNSTGEDVLKRLKENFGKFSESSEDSDEKHLDIVTFSQLRSTEIRIPPVHYFRHLEHWRKPLGYKALVERTLGLLDRLEI